MFLSFYLFIYFYTGPILIAVSITEMVILYKHIIIIIIIKTTFSVGYFLTTIKIQIGRVEIQTENISERTNKQKKKTKTLLRLNFTLFLYTIKADVKYLPMKHRLV